MLTRWLTAVALASVLAAPLTAPVTAAGAAAAGGSGSISGTFSEVRRYPRCGGGTSVIVNYERKAAGKPLGLTSKYW